MLYNSYIIKEYIKIIICNPVNYKLALAKGICHLLLWRLNPVLLQPLNSNAPEGVQGGVRHSVFQGIWWDKSLGSWMFLGTDFMISILASPHI